MGIYINPGNAGYKEAIHSVIYVDKSELISYTNRALNTKQKNMCVSRPRRFGKSMAADMLVAYYSKGCESEKLFAGRKANADRTFREHLNRHNVIRLDVQQFLFHESHLRIFIKRMQQVVITELRQEFGECFQDDSYGLPDVLRQIYGSTGKGFVFIIDEWDCVFRIAKERKEIQKEYLDFLRGLFKGAVVGMLGNARCSIDPSTCQNDMTTFKTKDDVFTLLVHLGYLSFDEMNSEAFIPNQEIAQEFLRAVKTGGWDGVVQALQRSDRLLQSTWEMDGGAVAAGVAAIHNETTSILKYNDENSLACTVLMAYCSAKAYYMNPILELPSGKGFADVVYLPKRDADKPALVVELKWNRSAAGAIRQIKDRQL